MIGDDVIEVQNGPNVRWGDGAYSGWSGEGDVGASDWRRKSVMFAKTIPPAPMVAL